MHFRTRMIALLLCLLVGFTLISCQTIAAILQPTPSPTATPTPTPTPTPEPTPSPTPSPGIDSFRVGLGDETGYISTFFGFGFRIPEGWKAYDRTYIDLLNMIQANSNDQNAYEQEYIDRLKQRENLYDYYAYHEAANEMILVYMKDFSEYKDGVISEQEVLDFHSASFFDTDGDGIADAKDIHSSTFTLGGTEHSVIYFYQTIGDVSGYGAMTAILKGTTYAITIIICPDEQTTQSVIDSFYPFGE